MVIFGMVIFFLLASKILSTYLNVPAGNKSTTLKLNIFTYDAGLPGADTAPIYIAGGPKAEFMRALKVRMPFAFVVIGKISIGGQF